MKLNDTTPSSTGPTQHGDEPAHDRTDRLAAGSTSDREGQSTRLDDELGTDGDDAAAALAKEGADDEEDDEDDEDDEVEESVINDDGKDPSKD